MAITLGWFDVLTLLIYFGVVVGVGLWVGRGQKDLASFMLGDRGLPWWAVLGSIVATETSTATFLSVPGTAYNGNMTFLQLACGYVIGRLIVAWILLPLYFRGQMMTAYEVLHKRFGGTTQRAASLIFLIARNLGDGLRLFLAAVVLEKVTGLSLPTSILLTGAFTIFYTVFGGMKSVVWSDCIQLVIYLAGGAIALQLIVRGIEGGWDGLWAYGTQHDKWTVFDFSTQVDKRYTIFSGLIGGIFLTLGTHGTDQMMVQRYLSAKNQNQAAFALVTSGVVVLLQFAFFLLVGVALAAFYSQHDPAVPITKGDEAFATFIVHDLPRNVGIIGLLVAAVFSAAMSTLSSSLNSSAAAAINDWVLPLRRGPKLDDDQQLKLGRAMTIVFGIVQIVIALVAQQWTESVVNNALTIAGFSAGLLLGIFFLGVFVRRADQAASLFGLLVGATVVSSVWIFTPITGIWYAFIGTLATFTSGLLASVVLGRSSAVPADTEQP